MRDNQNVLLGTLKTEHVGIDAGGFCTSFGITDDATVKVHGTDVGNAYVWGASDTEWRRVFVYDAYPAIDSLAPPADYHDSDGCYSICIAPSNGQVGYGFYRGALFATTDQFKTLTKVGTGYYPGFSNGGWPRWFNDKIAVDPIDPNTFVFGTQGKGAYFSIDGGATNPIKIGGPADVTMTHGRPLPVLVAVDRTSATVNGRKSRWAIHVSGQGVFQTTTGPNGSWTLMSGSPAGEMSSMIFDLNGVLYLSEINTGQKVHKCANGVWGTECSFMEVISFAVDKNGKKLITDTNGNLSWTNQDGSWATDVR